MNEKTIKAAEAYKRSKQISSLDALKLAKCNYAIMEGRRVLKEKGLLRANRKFPGGHWVPL